MHLRYCYVNETSCSDAVKMLQKNIWGVSLSRIQAFEWHKSFKNDRITSLENSPYAHHPATSINNKNVEKVKKILFQNRHYQKIATKLKISYASARRD